MAGHYTTEKEANAWVATTGGNLRTEEAARDAARATRETRKGTSISHFNIRRASKVGSGDFTIEARWRCSIKRGWLASDAFELDIEQYDKNTKRWSQVGNQTQKCSKSSFVKQKVTVKGKKKTVITYVYRFEAPNDATITDIRVQVRPISATHSVPKHYYTVEKKSKGTKGKQGYEEWWEYKDHKVSETVAFFLEKAWSKRESLPNPAYKDALDEKQRLKEEAPGKPGVPRATLEAGGKGVLLEFDPVEKGTADTCRLLYRCRDGAYTKSGRKIVDHSVIKGETTSFLDKGVKDGHEYRYYARAHNFRDHGKATGTWDQPPDFPGDLSEPVATPPVEVKQLKAAAYVIPGRDYMETPAEGSEPDSVSVRVTFGYPGYHPALTAAKVYYADDYQTLVTNKTSCRSADVALGASSLAVIIDGLEAAKKWWFGVWLKTGDDPSCERFCTSTASCLVATKPAAPTIIDLPRSVCLGEQFRIEWLHNSTDGSAQTKAQLEFRGAESGAVRTLEVKGSQNYLDVTPSPEDYGDGETVTVRVATAGVSGAYSPYAEKSLTVYKKPVTALAVTSPTGFGGTYGTTITSLPLEVEMEAGVEQGELTQSVLQWRLALYAAEVISYTDRYGNEAVIADGEKVAELLYDSYDDGFSSPAMTASMPATMAAFSNGYSYRLVLSALMDSGIEAEEDELEFTCAFEAGDLPAPVANIEAHPDWSAAIYPLCADARDVEEGDDYVVDSSSLVLAERAGGPFTLTVRYLDADGAEAVEEFEWDGEESEFEIGEWSQEPTVACSGARLSGKAYSSADPRENVLLSVYRVDPDGAMALVAGDVANGSGAVVVDRHPSFGAMNYRIVANDQETDEVVARDVSGENDWFGILIQWDEGNVATDGEGAFEPDFQFVMLPYNVTIQTKSAKDVALKNYIGRSHPVALHGTQVGESGNWSCQFPKREGDLELSQLRRLAAWMGTCWVRETSGLTYPANVDVSITRSYDADAVDVSLEVTRVDGD